MGGKGKPVEQSNDVNHLFFSKNNFDDFDQLISSFPVSSAKMEKLDSLPFYGELSIISTSDFSISKSHVSSQLKYTITAAGDSITFSLSTNELAVPIRVEGVQLTNQSLTIFTPGYKVNGVTFPGSSLYDIRISPSFVRKTYDQLKTVDSKLCLEINSLDSFSVEISTADMNDIRSDIETIFNKMGTPHFNALPQHTINKLKETITEKLIYQLYKESPHRRPLCSGARHGVIQKTIDFLERYEDFPISIPAICKEIGTSERTLRYAFTDFFSVSPKQYLQAFRLNEVRRTLNQTYLPGTKVIDIANRWGFSHMGKFSVDYKKLFGESPSETLRKSG